MRLLRYLIGMTLLITTPMSITQAAVEYIATPYQALPGWKKDNQAIALQAFQKSCRKLLRKPDSANIGRNPRMGTAKDWRSACEAALNTTTNNTQTARQFFETWLQPYAIKVNQQEQGLFTGYFEPTLPGSLTRSKTYSVPLYAWPESYISNSQNTETNDLYALPSRAAINQGALNEAGAEILWMKNKIDRLFLQVQGSGKIILPTGKTVQVGYAGKNGYPYTSVGRELIKRGELPKEKVSMQSIRKWLEDNPTQSQEILNANQSFVFFKVLNTNAPVGAQQVELTPRRSLAVDRQYIALGVPLFLETQIPTVNDKSQSFQHLLIAQDTGSAIKGAIRGDIFWGAGKDAKYTAGHMSQTGRYWALLPKK